MAGYKGRTVKLNKPTRGGDVKKSKVFVRDRSTGRVKKLILALNLCLLKKHIPARKRSFLARMGAVLNKVKGQKNLSPAYWSMKAWR